MGKLILCRGKNRASYLMPATGHRVYSIENYVITFIIIYTFLMNPSFLFFNRLDKNKSLRLPERADKLELIIKQEEIIRLF